MRNSQRWTTPHKPNYPHVTDNKLPPLLHLERTHGCILIVSGSAQLLAYTSDARMHFPSLVPNLLTTRPSDRPGADREYDR